MERNFRMRLLLIVGLTVLVVGCATHTYRIHGKTVELFLDMPDAESVILACSLDGFQPHNARYVDGRWVVKLPADAPFRYYYVVDGKKHLPACRMMENDDFGSQNCIFDPDV